MSTLFSTRQAAKKLKIDVATLSRYIRARKVPAPKVLEIGSLRVHSWNEEDIEKVRQILPTIKNGRKTWRQKQKTAAKKSKIQD